MSPSEQAYEYQRMRRMPEMIEATERKLVGLYREARRYGMTDILENRYFYNAAWDREVEIAKIEAAYAGGETTMAGDGV